VNSSEAMIDQYENVIVLNEEEQLNNCSVGTGVSFTSGKCLASGFNVTVLITDSPALSQIPRFLPGEVYYFTSKLIMIHTNYICTHHM